MLFFSILIFAFLTLDQLNVIGSHLLADGVSENDGRRFKRATSLSQAEIDGILNLHNELRGSVTPEASNMEHMTWDDTLATMAQQWADGCVWAHGQPTNISPFPQIGQNNWAGTAFNDGTGATQAFYDEVKYYDYDTTTCLPGKVCGHYTQVVWADSHALGCGRAFCPTLVNSFSNAYFIVCNYGPIGNYQGQKPYLTGPSCTQCGSGSGQCYNNLCRPCSEHSEPCECNASCKNCGTLTSDCRCSCQPGWIGSDCNTQCLDYHSNCGGNPGWPASWCGRYSFVDNNCPLLCGYCDPVDPNNICDPTEQTTKATTPTPAPTTTIATTAKATTARQTTASATTKATTDPPTTPGAPTTKATTDPPTTPGAPTTKAITDPPTTPSAPTTKATTDPPTTPGAPTTKAATDPPTTPGAPTTKAATDQPTSTGASTARPTTRPATRTPTSETRTSEPPTSSPEPSSTTATTMSTARETPPPCTLTCANGGELDSEACECDCPDDYQGNRCQNSKEQVRYGVILVIAAHVDYFPLIRNPLFAFVSELVTNVCNGGFFSLCCPGAMAKNTASKLSYVDSNHVSVADGFPVEVHDYAFPAFAVMLYVTPPTPTELCSDSTQAVLSKRSARESEITGLLARAKRHEESVQESLDQTVLYETILSNTAEISAALNVTVVQVSKGVVEAEEEATSRLTLELIIILIVAIIALLAVLVGVFTVCTAHKSGKSKAKQRSELKLEVKEEGKI